MQSTILLTTKRNVPGGRDLCQHSAHSDFQDNFSLRARHVLPLRGTERNKSFQSFGRNQAASARLCCGSPGAVLLIILWPPAHGVISIEINVT